MISDCILNVTIMCQIGSSVDEEDDDDDDDDSKEDDDDKEESEEEENQDSEELTDDPDKCRLKVFYFIFNLMALSFQDLCFPTLERLCLKGR